MGSGCSRSDTVKTTTIRPMLAYRQSDLNVSQLGATLSPDRAQPWDRVSLAMTKHGPSMLNWCE